MITKVQQNINTNKMPSFQSKLEFEKGLLPRVARYMEKSGSKWGLIPFYEAQGRKIDINQAKKDLCNSFDSWTFMDKDTYRVSNLRQTEKGLLADIRCFDEKGEEVIQEKITYNPILFFKRALNQTKISAQELVTDIKSYAANPEYSARIDAKNNRDYLKKNYID